MYRNFYLKSCFLIIVLIQPVMGMVKPEIYEVKFVPVDPLQTSIVFGPMPDQVNDLESLQTYAAYWANYGEIIMSLSDLYRKKLNKIAMGSKVLPIPHLHIYKRYNKEDKSLLRVQEIMRKAKDANLATAGWKIILPDPDMDAGDYSYIITFPLGLPKGDSEYTAIKDIERGFANFLIKKMKHFCRIM
jgi:hypothetical protein